MVTVHDPFSAAGELAPSYAAVDWDSTPLGPVADWSPTLLGAVDLMLRTRFPVTLLWGPELVLLYNPGYVQLITGKHPGALGRPCREVFPEAWSAIGPMLQGVLDGGDATWGEDHLFTLDRTGFLEQTYFTFSYSPVRGPDGRIEGVIDISVETTPQVVTARRLGTLARLHQELSSVDHVADLVPVALSVLRADHEEDLLAVDVRVPFLGERSLSSDPRLAGESSASGDRLEIRDGPHGPITLVPLPVVSSPQHSGTLVALLSPALPLDDDFLDYVRLLGFALAQYLELLVSRDAERIISTALQESLLSRPRHSPLVDIAVRYQPAAEAAQVGGDWYDAFVLPDGDTLLVVGDVTGHDHNAAAAMGQLRSLLRAMAYHTEDAPGAVISAMERAMAGLELTTLATTFVGRLATGSGRPTELVWSSAGHVPPVVVEPTGRAWLLQARPELLVGLHADTRRHDHRTTLTPGSAVVLYTDGLVERRREHLDQGLTRLRDVLAEARGLTAEEVCDLLLDRMAPEAEDDVALLVLRLPS